MTNQKAFSSKAPTGFRLSALAALVSAFSAPALAQTNDSEQAPPAPLEEVVVTGTTGTLLRGVAPIGTNTVGLDRESVEEIGTPDSNELLAQIPQVSSTFNSRPTMSSDVGQGMPMPKLRDLGQSGSSTTLVLMNGLRLPGSGLIQTVPNAAAIPPGVLERLEIVLDGGSSIYGSDAIGGVINFITREPFDGAELSLEGGFGEDYASSSVNLTLGKDWGTGSGMVSLYHNQNDDVKGADREFISADRTAKGGGDDRSTQCAMGNVTINDVSYAYPNRAPNSVNLCDQTDVLSYVPKASSSTVFAGLQQDISDRVSLDVTTFYSEWDTEIQGRVNDTTTAYGVSGTITDSNPYFDPIGSETEQSVDFSLAPLGHPAAQNYSEFDAFSFMPELTVELSGDWRLKAAYGYGVANTLGVEPRYNIGAVNDSLAATTEEEAINPYDVTAGSTAQAVIDGIFDFYGTYGDAKQSHHQLRAVVDGTAFSLPTGDVQLAVGVEYFEQNYEVAYGSGPSNDLNLVHADTSRDVSSLFGEVVFPVMDSSAGTIDMTASARYDDYSDFGSTTNPKIGIDYVPNDTIRFRAQWGTSFQAPSLADSEAAVDTRAINLPAFVAPDPADEGNFEVLSKPMILLAGGSEGLQPEESESWSAGFDLTPISMEDFEFSLTYFSLDYESAISIPPVFNGALLYSIPELERFINKNPTREEAIALTEGFRTDGFQDIESLYDANGGLYAINDARRYNMGAVKLSGIDFDLSQTWSTDFGSVNAGVGGSYYLERENQPALGADYFDELEQGRFGQYDVVTRLGATAGNLSGSMRVLHSDGWDDASGTLDSYTTVNLYGSYSFNNSMFEETLLTVNVDNVLDEEPPFWNDSDGFLEGNPLGRVIYLGVKVGL